MIFNTDGDDIYWFIYEKYYEVTLVELGMKTERE